MLKPIVPESLYEYSIIEDPQFSPDGKYIAFVKQTADDASNGYLRSIWIIETAGRHQPRQFTFGAQDFCPRWSPDSKTLAFISTRSGIPQAFRIPLEGGEAVQITSMVSGVSNLCWSPDGKWIAFNADSTEAEHELEDRELLYSSALSADNKAWSQKQRDALRDPREITKLPYRTGTAFFDGCYHHVYIVPSEGGAPKRLTNGDYHHAAPVWSRDSRCVITNSNRDQSNGEENFELWSSIFSYDIESGEETRILHEVSEEGGAVDISPDGKWLMYTYVPKIPSPYQDPYYVAVSPYEANSKPQTVSDENLTIAKHHFAADSEHVYFIIHTQGKAKLARLTREEKDMEILIEGDFMVENFNVDPNL